MHNDLNTTFKYFKSMKVKDNFRGRQRPDQETINSDIITKCLVSGKLKKSEYLLILSKRLALNCINKFLYLGKWIKNCPGEMNVLLDLH